MNWTGGSLQRTKKANTGVLQQQKAYFAKARTHLQNATNSPVPPFRPSYLRDNEESGLMGELPSFSSGSVRHTGYSARGRGDRTRREPIPDDAQSATGFNEFSTLKEPLAHVARRSASRVRKHANKGRADGVLPSTGEVMERLTTAQSSAAKSARQHTKAQSFNYSRRTERDSCVSKTG